LRRTSLADEQGDHVLLVLVGRRRDADEPSALAGLRTLVTFHTRLGPFDAVLEVLRPHVSVPVRSSESRKAHGCAFFDTRSSMDSRALVFPLEGGPLNTWTWPFGA